MADDLIFYTHPKSRGRIVRWMLEEAGRPYKTEILQFGTSMKSPDYLAFNPMGKVPTIIHKGTVVTEAAAICAYLADAFPEAGLAPLPGDSRRGPYYRWMFFAAGPVEACLSNKALGFQVPDERRGMVGYGCIEDVTNALEYAVTQFEYIAGDRFSAADVYVGSQIGWGMMFGTLEKRPAFEAYWGRINSRPAAIRAREIDDALVAAQQQASQ
ncbi:glutathione S-transferase [Microvirga sp. KLBC 81]|uniref:glutathione S-transferase family protein n=1 Tax=Microvirga sp. KLBC 81 TaxID=1862707 RepID=UPI000D50754A|nr:glutathione S-transferase family protein [Microvirga sp. KLBC 81]PVE24088.1 glutathione S-transferase [Microvirga sp. KLBC 81]